MFAAWLRSFPGFYVWAGEWQYGQSSWLEKATCDVKILVLGGTVFLGRHIVEAALARGHEVTLFNRGRQNPDLFPMVEKLRGDRDSDLAAVRGRAFDAVVDPSAYRPEQVRAVAATLGDTGHYTFISSVSVYERFPPGRSFNEDAPLAAGSKAMDH